MRGARYECVPEHENGEGHDTSEAQADAPVETEPTEITPLMHQHRQRGTDGHEYVVSVDGDLVRVDNSRRANAPYEESGWWIVQMLAVVPIPALLEFQLLVLLMHSLGNTMVDGSPAVIGMCFYC